MVLKQKKLVSVIIPVYNGEKFISDSIKSILDQSWKNLEIIIVNDGSTDNTGNILSSFSHEKRIRIIEQMNKGCSSAKNTGLKEVKGDFIQYLDADDLLSADKISQQVKVLEDVPEGIAVCKTVVFDQSNAKETGIELDTDFLFSSENTFEFLMNLYGKNGRIGMIQPNSFLLSKELAEKIGGWNTSLSPSPDEDGEYFCRAILNASKIIYTQGTNYYRKIPHVSSLSKGESLLFAKGAFKSIQLKAQHLLSINNSEMVRDILSIHFASVAYLYGAHYPEIVLMAEAELNKMGIKKIPGVGGSNFKVLSSIIGFQSAIKFKRFMLK